MIELRLEFCHCQNYTPFKIQRRPVGIETESLVRFVQLLECHFKLCSYASKLDYLECIVIYSPRRMKAIEVKMEVSCLPTKRDLARIRLIAHARMQFKQLPHALAVNTSTRNPGLTTREMTD